MHSMFYGAAYFNQPLNSWNVSNVTDMSYMFHGAATFHQNLCRWFALDFQELPFVLRMFRGTGCADIADPSFVTKKSFCGMCA
jgi:surface protein